MKLDRRILESMIQGKYDKYDDYNEHRWMQWHFPIFQFYNIQTNIKQTQLKFKLELWKYFWNDFVITKASS